MQERKLFLEPVFDFRNGPVPGINKHQWVFEGRYRDSSCYQERKRFEEDSESVRIRNRFKTHRNVGDRYLNPDAEILKSRTYKTPSCWKGKKMRAQWMKHSKDASSKRIITNVSGEES